MNTIVEKNIDFLCFYELKDYCLLCLIQIEAFLLHGLNFFLFNGFSKVLSLGMLAEILQKDLSRIKFFFEEVNDKYKFSLIFYLINLSGF